MNFFLFTGGKFTCPLILFREQNQSEISYVNLGLVANYSYRILNTRLPRWLKNLPNLDFKLKFEIVFHPGNYGIMGTGIQG